VKLAINLLGNAKELASVSGDMQAFFSSAVRREFVKTNS
jgi:hypothetical protein